MSPLLALILGFIFGALFGAVTVIVVAVSKGQPGGDRNDWYGHGL